MPIDSRPTLKPKASSAWVMALSPVRFWAEAAVESNDRPASKTNNFGRIRLRIPAVPAQPELARPGLAGSLCHRWCVKWTAASSWTECQAVWIPYLRERGRRSRVRTAFQLEAGMAAEHNILEAIGNTPLVELRRIVPSGH